MMIATARPDPALARAILVAMTARPGDAITYDALAAELRDDAEALEATLDAMERAGQVERTPGTDLITLGAGAARRLKRPRARAAP